MYENIRHKNIYFAKMFIMYSINFKRVQQKCFAIYENMYNAYEKHRHVLKKEKEKNQERYKEN